MRKLLLCLLALLAASLLAVACAEASTTLLVYMCGADLQDAACLDICEMGMAEVGDDVNIVVLAGGATDWEFDELKGNTRNLVTLRNGDFETVEDWGWKSMGSAESLLEFLEYGLKTYPAQRTIAVLWDHGAGSEAGICFDHTAPDQDSLSLLEINDVLYDLDERLGGFHIDVFGCDACMMATYEMAVMLSCYDIDCFVASEELETGLGWDYTSWLEALAGDANMTNKALCERILDTYMDAALKENPDDWLTLSAVDLKAIEPLRQTVEGFASVLLGELEQGNVADVSRGRSQMYTFGSFVDGSWDMVDMGVMLDAYAHYDPDGAAQARRQLSEAVMASRQSDKLDACSGLSVLIPQDTKAEFETYSDGLDLSFYMPNWIGFVKAYAGQLTGGSHSFATTMPQQVSGGSFISQIAGQISGTWEDYAWDDDGQTYVPAEPQQPQIAFSEGDYAFTASLTEDDMRYLDYVEGMLLMEFDEGDAVSYVDFGLMRNNLVDWSAGNVYSLFDGTWPVFGDQLVPLYDQLSNDRGRRSLIPVKLNGEATYLVVEFPAEGGEGRILGANAGYDENGLPIRTVTPLKAGDRIVPVYTLYTVTDDSDDMQEDEFDGDEIIWQDGMTVAYEDLGDDEGDPMTVAFCFVLNDVFGEVDMTDLIEFEV